MKKIVLPTMLISVFILAAMAVPAMSQVAVGVAVDDWFYYTVDITQTSNATTAYVPNIIGTLNPGTGYTHNDLLNNNYMALNRTVTAVDGTSVTFKEEWKLQNESIMTYNDVVANVTDCNVYWAVIPADLEADDALSVNPTYAYPQGGSFTINGTESRTYAGDTREACTLGYNYDHGNGMAYFNASYSWDQTTGILVDSNLTTYFVQSGALTTTIFLFELYASSEWTVVPEFSSATVMLLMFTAVAASVELIRRKKLKH